METSKEVFKLAHPNLYKVLVELVYGNTSGALRQQFALPEYLVGNLGKLEDLARTTFRLMITIHGGNAPEDGGYEYQVIAYGEEGDQISLLNRKPELYLLSLFLNDVFQGNLKSVFIQQRDMEGALNG